ncbi:Pkinase domain-containing protein/WD40 domain-containing protein [Cephalotus follicularis]|uniref:Pkinase domain-containing protein/WD40 domain-containing protein n=1 Tax=Cephalotus follicularis TaxID=3775 RepID=A0A1Q3B6L8_CEPFO|nr:Pkinase domain-containing protein/WD40 domain-containing protein [Cephalotus follicularis]
MDEGLGDSMTSVDVVEGQHRQGKENILEGKNVNINLSPMDTSDRAGGMVEELTVRNFNNENLAIVGTSNNREIIQTRHNQWQHLYQIAGGSEGGSSRGNRSNDDNGLATSGGKEVFGYTSFPESLADKQLGDDNNGDTEELTNAENNVVLGNRSSHGIIRTKILSKSGFSDFLVKTTLKGKGILYRGPPQNGIRVENRDQNYTRPADVTLVASNASLKAAIGTMVVSNGSLKAAAGALVASDASLSLGVKKRMPSFNGVAGPGSGVSDQDGVTLRAWLKAACHKVSKVECLAIFKQIVDLVEHSHSQGSVLHDMQPSCFKLLQSNQVKYLGSIVSRGGLDSATDKESTLSEKSQSTKRPVEKGIFHCSDVFIKKQKFSENLFSHRWPQFTSSYGFKTGYANDSDINIDGTQYSHQELSDHNLSKEYGIRSNIAHVSNTAQQPQNAVIEQLEGKWYTSPEELNEGICTTSSNIYSLGILLFELLGRFDSERALAAAMSDIRHRILPPKFLSENPKEAGFCLWLIHPEPSSRPTTREILHSDIVNMLPVMCPKRLSSSIDQDDAESELLFHFLVSLKEHKQKHASKLDEDVRCLESDIKEVERRQCLKKPLLPSSLHSDFPRAWENRFVDEEPSGPEALSRLSPNSTVTEMRLLRNVVQLENAYFSMRSKIQLPETDVAKRPDEDLLRNREHCYSGQKGKEELDSADPLGVFFDGLCKYARYNKFEVRGLLRTGDFSNSANVICSLSFDRDNDYFAAAGISKKIKIFEFNALFNDSVDIHYPVVEMSNKSRLSCVCWNSYIKNYLASTDYDGVVKLWDASTGQGVSQYIQHEKRAWSVDFSQLCPTKFASGSDDCSVKLWNINEKNCLSTIRNHANVCCVQFSAHSTHLLAFGSADYKTYCYDVRNVRFPWCVLAGHDKAVSYVKFLDSETIVTASTDSTLKLWDLNRTSPSGLSANACSLTLSGHTNDKNFVGLSTADGYVACGSETNEVYAYHRSLPMPITSHKFGSIDPISGKYTDDDNGLFVSSVCWRGKSDMVIAANSSGCIKVLQMV